MGAAVRTGAPSPSASTNTERAMVTLCVLGDFVKAAHSVCLVFSVINIK